MVLNHLGQDSLVSLASLMHGEETLPAGKSRPLVTFAPNFAWNKRRKTRDVMLSWLFVDHWESPVAEHVLATDLSCLQEFNRDLDSSV